MHSYVIRHAFIRNQFKQTSLKTQNVNIESLKTKVRSFFNGGAIVAKKV